MDQRGQGYSQSQLFKDSSLSFGNRPTADNYNEQSYIQSDSQYSKAFQTLKEPIGQTSFLSNRTPSFTTERNFKSQERQATTPLQNDSINNSNIERVKARNVRIGPVKNCRTVGPGTFVNSPNDPSSKTVYRHESYLGPSSWKYQADLAKMPSKRSLHVPEWRTYQQADHGNRVRLLDSGNAPRYPYLTSYLHDRYGDSLCSDYDWWYYHFPRRSEYWNSVHTHGRFHDRLNPSYLSVYDKYNSSQNYVPNHESYRLSHPEEFSDKSQPENKVRRYELIPQDLSEYSLWLKDKYHDMPKAQRMEMLDKFYASRYSQDKVRGILGGTYLPPSRLYANKELNKFQMKGKYHLYLTIQDIQPKIFKV